MGTAGLFSLRGSDPVIATVMMQGSAFRMSINHLYPRSKICSGQKRGEKRLRVVHGCCLAVGQADVEQNGGSAGWGPHVNFGIHSLLCGRGYGDPVRLAVRPTYIFSVRCRAGGDGGLERMCDRRIRRASIAG